MMHPLLDCFTKHFNSEIGEAVLVNKDIICHNIENLEGLFVFRQFSFHFCLLFNS